MTRKRRWGSIRGRGCQDPADEREAVGEDELRAVLGRDRANMIRMAGLVSRTWKRPEERETADG